MKQLPSWIQRQYLTYTKGSKHPDTCSYHRPDDASETLALTYPGIPTAPKQLDRGQVSLSKKPCDSTIKLFTFLISTNKKDTKKVTGLVASGQSLMNKYKKVFTAETHMDRELLLSFQQE